MPDVILSPLLAPADAAVWARYNAAVDRYIAEMRPPKPHRCTDTCRTYTGPVRLGRDGEQITPGRAR